MTRFRQPPSFKNLRPTGVRAILFFIISYLFVSPLLFPPTALASGESHKWTSLTSIEVSGGDLSTTATLTVEAVDKGGGASGTFILHDDSNGFCRATVHGVVSDDNKKLTYDIAIIPDVIVAPGQPGMNCSDEEEATVTAWRGSSFSIAGKRPVTQEETAKQKEIDVVLSYPGDPKDAPDSVTFTMRWGDGPDKKISFKSNKAVHYEQATYSGTFSNVNPGQYTLSVDKGDPKSQTVTKKKFQRLLVGFGESSSSMLIRVETDINPVVDDPAKDQSFGPYPIELRTLDKKVLDTKNVSGNYVASEDCKKWGDCGGTTNVHLYSQVNFKDVQPGKYEVCFGNVCVPAHKKENENLLVKLAFSQSDIDAAEEAGEGGGEGDDAPICSAGALGWVLCPLSEAMVGAIEGIANLLESFLVFQPLTTSEQGKAIQAIWGSLLGIANAGLIIAFLVVVFSQATSIGLNSYGIKKLLPRVIAAAILMNLSFYLCAVAVDISNILGVSIKGIADVGLEAVSSGINNPDLKADPSVGDWIAISTVGLLGAAILVGTGAIFLLIPVLISGLMAILTAFLILAARQVLITLLIIIAPLAILAWILPNTESWFTKWRKLFTTLLLLYPMVMAIFYGAILVSSVILASAGDSGNALNNWTVQILAFLVLVVPLFSLPFVMKAAGGVMDRLGVLVNNRNKGLVDRSRKKGRELYERGGYARGKGIRTQAKTELRNKRFAGRLDRAYGGTGNWRDNLTRAQAGGAAEIAKMAGETKVAQAAKSGASKAANKGVAGLYGVSPAVGDLGAQVVAGTVNAANRLPGREMRDAQRAALQRATRGVVASATSKAVEDEILRLEELPHAANPDTFEQYGRSQEAQNDVTQRAISEMLSTRYGGLGVNKVASMLKDPTYMSGAGAEGFVNGVRKNAPTYAAAHPDVGYALNDAEFVSKSSAPGGNPDVVRFDWNARIAGDSGKIIKLKTPEQAAHIAAAPNFTVEVAERAYNSPAYGDASPPIQEVIAAKLRAAGKIT